MNVFQISNSITAAVRDVVLGRNACVFEVLLYAAETWTTKKDDQRRLLGIWGAVLQYRWILRVKDHITNDEVRSQVKREWTVMDIIRKRRLQLFDHICIMPDDCLPGWPAWRWIDDVLWCGKDIETAVMMTEDRGNWRRSCPPAAPYGDSKKNTW